MKRRRQLRNRLLAALVVVWGLVLWNQFGSSPGAEAGANPVVVPVSTTTPAVTAAPAAVAAPPAHVAPQHIRYLQERVAKLPFERNPFQRVAAHATPATQVGHVDPPPDFVTPAPRRLRVTSVIGTHAVINGTRVRVGEAIPGTGATLVATSAGAVEIEIDGRRETIPIARPRP